MSEKSGSKYIQCTKCGHVYIIDEDLSLIDDMYVNTRCPRCKNKKGLNLGNDIDDYYELYNLNLDERYY